MHSRRVTLLQLTRPLVHIGLIILSYRLMYLLRQYTDLIPFVQLRIPQIDIRETIRFALGSGVLFVLVGFAHNVY